MGDYSRQTAQIQYAEADTAAAEVFGEREHVLGRSSKALHSRDDESVAGLDCCRVETRA